MRVIWLKRAVEDLGRYRHILRLKNPQTAGKRVQAVATHLGRFPNAGRPVALPGIRKIAVPGLPYVIFYRVGDNAVEILRVFHSRQDLAEMMP
jgi:toxin ParE1/3/4